MRNHRIGVLLAVTVTLASVVTAAASADDPGFKTSAPAMLTARAQGASVEPLISVGDTLGNGYRFEAIPDGISLDTNGRGTVDAFVNHETSLVPFPFTGNLATCTATTCFSDFDNAKVSRLRLHQGSAGVLSGEIAIGSAGNYQRFCSNYLAGPEQGFRRSILFANEEATDFVSRPPLLAWPPDPANQRQAGLVVALDARNGKTYEIPGLGRMNHENTVVVPGGWNGVAALTGDDTFSAPASQLYMYTAASDDAMLADGGALWAFRVTAKNGTPVTPGDAFNGANDYGDVASGDSLAGEFIEVPKAIATGDQTPLENWSNANNVFQFIRVEDIAYDKRSPRVVYFADTGEPRAIPNPATGRLQRGSSTTTGPYMNGRVFKMVLNATNPRVVDSLSILVNADLGGYNNPNVLHQPDNVDTSASGSLMIQEDPGSHNGQRAAFPNATNARVWRFDLTQGTLAVAAEVDQSLVPASSKGSWESSGIVDASSAFGPGAWLVDVQAHTLNVESEVRTVTAGGASGQITFKREGGQLLLLRVPGS